MAPWSRWLGVGAAVGIVCALVPIVRGSVALKTPISALSAVAPEREEPQGPDLEGLDLLRLDIRASRVTTPLPGGRTAELTLDPLVQRTAISQMKRYRVPEAGVVMIDVKTGEVLAYASHVTQGDKFDVNARAEAPAASIFKIVTAAALVERADLVHETEQCYRGGKSRISAEELRDDPERDKWCATLAIAMGRSLNVVFARLAQKHLTPAELSATGGAFGFGASVPFVVENETSSIDIPNDPLEFARAAAGFWHTSLSPLAGALLAQTVANAGVALEPRIVRFIEQDKKKIWEDKSEPHVLRRAMRAQTANELRVMMEQTVPNGSAYKMFHDAKGRSFLPDIEVAGKTGTLTRHEANRHYTWFVGFAPAKKPEVAVAALVVNTPLWHIKGPHLARDVLRAYFAKQGKPGVSAP
ncbi:MAG TPA: penicillin-binding transpeptidase domain-containing protein [Polyangiaceae bacterium]|jgi:cell division protein FtsI/penicillin-binding protein 2